MDGILLIDKPAGVTSFKVVNQVRQALVAAFPELAPRRGRRPAGVPKPPRFKCGHAGTLDPLATGLLVVLVGKGSRLAPFLLGQDKTYAATVRFGSVTDTLDRDGEVVGTAPAPANPEAVADCLPLFRGEIQQVPPVISALKKDGQPLYKLARSGQDVPEPDARPVTIHRLDMTASAWGVPQDDPVYEVELEVSCSSGTYIRSLARDLARAAGSEGHIHSLRRLEVGPFKVADAASGVMEKDGDDLAASLLRLSAALPHVPAVTFDATEAAAIRQGQQPGEDLLERLDGEPVAAGKAGRLFRILDADGDLVAVGKIDETTGRPVLAAVIPRDDAPAD
ncbi:MAG: tRNA pseudouridine(55) synthase TruB [Candidatus Krumholzibacteriota bacterium]